LAAHHEKKPKFSSKYKPKIHINWKATETKWYGSRQRPHVILAQHQKSLTFIFSKKAAPKSVFPHWRFCVRSHFMVTFQGIPPISVPGTVYLTAHAFQYMLWCLGSRCMNIDFLTEVRAHRVGVLVWKSMQKI
jgi:hypothetical protein